MVTSILQVALGGAIGATLRFGAGVAMARLSLFGLPVAILMVNVLGSFLMGLVAVWALERGGAHLAPFLMSGILGGFTTFSAFSLETVALIERGEIAPALAYVLLSVGLSVGALALGLGLARGLWA